MRCYLSPLPFHKFRRSARGFLNLVGNKKAPHILTKIGNKNHAFIRRLVPEILKKMRCYHALCHRSYTTYALWLGAFHRNVRRPVRRCIYHNLRCSSYFDPIKPLRFLWLGTFSTSIRSESVYPPRGYGYLRN